ncbi:MAG: ANTAR domain-containing response regulator [Egibacteraceae bacterium]
MRVLIAEDDPVIALGLEAKLAALGHEVVGRVGDGQAAVALAERAQPDAIVMDLVMPGMDGLEAARQITSSRGVAIVAITAHDDPGLVARAIDAGVAAYLVKPVDARQVDSALRLAVARYAEFRALHAEVDRLADALETRKLVERAKGILMDRAGLGESEAFTRIQRRARSHNQTMSQVAREIIDTAKLLE